LIAPRHDSAAADFLGPAALRRPKLTGAPPPILKVGAQL